MKKDFGAKAWIYPMPVLIIGSLFAASNRQTYRDAQGRLQGTKK